MAQLRGQNAPAARDSDEARINGEITAREVRLIDENGEQLGIVRTRDALTRAAEVALDLVEVAPNASPPVCKIMDYGKFKYQQSKKMAEARKKQKQIEVKEIKFRPGTEDHDYQVKMRNIVRFLEDGDKAKITLRFRGREMAHKDIASELLDRIERDLAELAVVEQRPKMEGRQVTMVMAPKKNN
ncbi:translation initiation factor IF-3 [Halothiobacillus diazotrophicus]|uniref:Translation initiation factor IF-3 n=1 Tax=Halothiobacillus diazotrophicus TaxID=1860122 RepID=A0A191ZK49_9GAMM|nr:translation initiation factor IF-3 [Halothiobacillus diazotrophicus]ANJ68281.1 translation initiation factor IF-3 [Halothiobacillus diazotrophicus]